MPRNIAPDCADLEGVYCFDVDDLKAVSEQGMEKRRRSARNAESIIREETSRVWKLLLGQSVRNEIGSLVKHADAIRQAELARAGKALAALDPKQQKAVDAMTRSIVKKLLHRPLAQARAHAEAGDIAEVSRILDTLLDPDLPDFHD